MVFRSGYVNAKKVLYWLNTVELPSFVFVCPMVRDRITNAIGTNTLGFSLLFSCAGNSNKVMFYEILSKISD